MARKPDLNEAILQTVRSGTPPGKNGNGTSAKLIAALISMAVAYLGFTTYQIYIDSPRCYATKAEVREIKSELKDDMKYIRDRVDKILERLP